MLLKPIEKKKRVYQVIIERLKEAIERGDIQPGDQLPSERNLAASLSVSRTSVKEAITVLESSGIVTVRPGVGMFLKADATKELLMEITQIIEGQETHFQDLLELRKAIEGDAAYYAAERMTMKEKESLTAIYNQLISIEAHVEAAVQKDYEFHFAIMKAAKNPVMLKVMNLVADQIRDALKQSRDNSLTDLNLNRTVMNEHHAIYEAIIHQQPKAAKEAMWEHHQGIEERYLNMKRKQG